MPIDFEGGFLSVHQSVGIVLAAAAGGRHPDAGPAGGDFLVALPQLRHDGIEVLEPDVDQLDGLPHRKMHLTLPVFFGDLNDLSQPLDRHASTGHPEADRKEILASLLDETSGLEILQINRSFLLV